jgi:hypothetical protein
MAAVESEMLLAMAERKDRSDPTEDPKFQEVVRHFLKTPPKPHRGGAVKKPLTESDEKKQGGRPSKRDRPAKGQ